MLWSVGAVLAVLLSVLLQLGNPLIALAVVVGVALVMYLGMRRARREAESRFEDLADRIERLGAEVLRPVDRSRGTQGAVEIDVGPRAGLDGLAARLDARRAELEDRLIWLLEARAALRAIIDGVDAPVFAIDESGQVRLVNRSGERLFRRRSGKLAGLSLEELFTARQVLDLHERAQSGESVRERVTIPMDGQTHVFEITASPVRMDIADLPARARPSAGAVLTLRDVTDLARTVQLRTDFVANASHELRTPIASIRAAVETMRATGVDEPDMRERLIAMIEGNVVRLEEMVEDLLDLSTLETNEQRPDDRPIRATDLAGTLDQLFADTLRRRNLSLAFDLDPALERLRSDPKLLQLVLRNLVDNASKFAFDETEIRVVGRVEPDLESDRDTAVFEVVDHGVGIPIKHQDRVFERFFQVDESRVRAGGRRGTGLGLAIVKHAVRRLDGDVDLESIYQQGTTIRVRLPRCVERASAATQRAKRRPVIEEVPGDIEES